MAKQAEDQTEQHVSQKSNKSLKLVYSFFQIIRPADGFVASVPDCPGVSDQQPFWYFYAASQIVRNHARSLHVAGTRFYN